MATLVTGGAGYVGSHAVVALHATGRDVVVLDDFSNASRGAIDALRQLTTGSLPVVEGDACDPATLGAICDAREIDSVLHFAACKAVSESISEPLRYYRNNLVSTIALLEVMLERGVGRLVFSSSAAVYGQPDKAPVDETQPYAPASPYGRTKAVCEQILGDAVAVSQLRVMLLRYFNPVGAHTSGSLGEDPSRVSENLVPRVMAVALGLREQLSIYGGDYETDDGTALRDYVHVCDVAEGHVAALDAFDRRDDRVAVYNLGTGIGRTVLEVVTAASQVTGRSIAHEIMARRPGDVAAIWADCSKARRELGWTARRDLETMLRDHWNWQRTHPNGYSS